MNDRQEFCKNDGNVKKEYRKRDKVVPDVIDSIIVQLNSFSKSDLILHTKTVILGMVLVVHQQRAQTWSLNRQCEICYQCFCTDSC